MEAEVLVIGAGLAGLKAARTLERAGVVPLVVDAADAVGGRLRTDGVDGFRVDRGFQVLNPAYPALREAVDVPRLALGPFGRGVAVRTASGLTVLADPTRSPLSVGSLLKTTLADAAGARALTAWLLPAFRGRDVLAALPDAALSASLDDAGVHGPLRTEVLEPFLAGVLADADGATSAAFARWLVHWFVRGTPGLPAQGMAAVPAQLRSGLRAEVRLGVRVDALERTSSGWLATTDGGPLTASAVVVAADPATSARLTGRPAPRLRGLATWWLAPDEAPTDSRFLLVDGERRGPIVNTVVISNAQPSYAPAGRHLVQASTLLPGEGNGDGPSEADVRAHLGVLYGRPATDWPVLAVHRLPHALPAIEPGGWRRVERPEHRLVVAGDAHDASIQGALESGRDAARLLLAALGRGAGAA